MFLAAVSALVDGAVLPHDFLLFRFSRTTLSRWVLSRIANRESAQGSESLEFYSFISLCGYHIRDKYINFFVKIVPIFFQLISRFSHSFLVFPENALFFNIIPS
jgi:hypothetical protein